MFADLREWEQAKKWAQTTDVMNISDLIRMQALWAEETGDLKGAVEMYLAAGDILRAVSIFGEKGWVEELIELTRSLDK
jgi:intraflagellar transport protein 122